MRDKSRTPPWKALAGLTLIGGVVLAQRELARLRRRRAFPDDGPTRTRTGLVLDRPAAGASVRVNAAPEGLMAFWRDPANLPLLAGVPSVVTSQDDGSFVWDLGPGGGPRLHLRRVEERVEGAGGTLAWESVAGSETAAEARLVFRPAPGNRGAIVSAEVRRPPGRAAVAEEELRRALRRFRMLAETGEIALARAAAPIAPPDPPAWPRSGLAPQAAEADSSGPQSEAEINPLRPRRGEAPCAP